MDKEKEVLRTTNSKTSKYFTGKRNKNEFKEKYDSTTEDENNKQIQNFAAPNLQDANKYDGDIKKDGNPTDKTHLLDCEKTNKKSKLKIPKYLKIGGFSGNLKNNSYVFTKQNENHKQSSAAVNLHDANKCDGDIKKNGIPKDKTHLLNCEESNKKSKLNIPKYLKLGQFSGNLKKNSYVSTEQNENHKQNSVAVNLQDANKCDGDIKKDGNPTDKTHLLDYENTNKKSNLKIPKYLKMEGFSGNLKKNSYVSTKQNENHKQNSTAVNLQDANKCDGDIKKDGNPTDKTHLLDCEKTNKKNKLKIPKYLKIGRFSGNLKNNSYVFTKQNENHKQNPAAVNLQNTNKCDGDINKEGILKDKTHNLDCEKTNKKSKLKMPKYLKIEGFKKNFKNNSYVSTRRNENHKQNSVAINLQDSNKCDGDIKKDGNPTDKTHLFYCEESNKKSKLNIPKYLKIGEFSGNLKNNIYVSTRQNENHKQNSASVNLQDANKCDGDKKKDGIPKDETHFLDCEETNKKKKMKIPKYLKIRGLKKHSKKNRYVSITDDENREHFKNSAAINFQGIYQYGNEINKGETPKGKADLSSCDKSHKKRKMKIPKYLKIGGLKKHSKKNSLHPLKKHSKKNRYVSIIDDESHEHIKNSVAINFQGINQYGNEINNDGIPKDKAVLLSCDKSNKKRKMKIPKYLKIGGLKKHSKKNRYVSITDDENCKLIKNSVAINFQGINQYDDEINKKEISIDKVEHLNYGKNIKTKKLKIPNYLKIGGLKKHSKNNRYISMPDDENREHIENSVAINFRDIDQYGHEMNKEGIPKDNANLFDYDKSNLRRNGIEILSSTSTESESTGNLETFEEIDRDECDCRIDAKTWQPPSKNHPDSENDSDIDVDTAGNSITGKQIEIEDMLEMRSKSKLLKSIVCKGCGCFGFRRFKKNETQKNQSDVILY